jgi:hypothetical protein
MSERLRSNPNPKKEKLLPQEEERDGFFPWAITDEHGNPLYMNPLTGELEPLIKEDSIGNLIKEVEKQREENISRINSIIKNLEDTWWSITRWKNEVTFSSWFKQFSIPYDTPLHKIEEILIEKTSTEA